MSFCDGNSWFLGSFVEFLVAAVFVGGHFVQFAMFCWSLSAILFYELFWPVCGIMASVAVWRYSVFNELFVWKFLETGSYLLNFVETVMEGGHFVHIAMLLVIVSHFVLWIIWIVVGFCVSSVLVWQFFGIVSVQSVTGLAKNLYSDSLVFSCDSLFHILFVVEFVLWI